MNHFKMKSWPAALMLALSAWAGHAGAQGGADDAAPSLDELLGLDDGGAQDPGSTEPPADSPEAPALNTALERRLSGQEAADQFAQAVQDMADAAARLDDTGDPGVDTQRLQDEIILKLEQIIASAQNTQEGSGSGGSSGSPQQQARQADRGGEQQGGSPSSPGSPSQPGEGADPQGQQPDEAGSRAAQQGDSEAAGETNGRPPRPDDVRNTELSMQELREGEWGNLPPRLRDELAESLGESFNPVYRAVTEAYYRRIAELSRQEAGQD